MKALLLIFSILLILLIAGLWVGPGSYPDLWRLDDRIVVQQEENADKQEQIDKIQAELNDAASSREALEERARSELGMTKKGETFFEVIMQPETTERKQNVSGEFNSLDNDSKKNEADTLKQQHNQNQAN